MPYYRLFFLDKAERVAHAEIIACGSDAELPNAVSKLLSARAPMRFPMLEVWQSERQVFRAPLHSIVPELPANPKPRRCSR